MTEEEKREEAMKQAIEFETARNGLVELEVETADGGGVWLDIEDGGYRFTLAEAAKIQEFLNYWLESNND